MAGFQFPNFGIGSLYFSEGGLLPLLALHGVRVTSSGHSLPGPPFVTACLWRKAEKRVV